MSLPGFRAWALTLATAGLVAAQDWKPAAAPLMTRWGKEIDAAKTPWPEYPRPQLVRKDWLNLNGLWDYAIAPVAAPKPEAWAGKILVPFCIESALSGVGKTVGKENNLWYRREFTIPADWKGKRLLLHFGAVDWQSTVFVNGTQVGLNKGGNNPFSFDVTKHCPEGKCEIVLKVWDPTDDGAQPRGKQVLRPHGIWYTSVTGIWQTVWMEPAPEESINRIIPSTEGIDGAEARLRVSTWFRTPAGADPKPAPNPGAADVARAATEAEEKAAPSWKIKVEALDGGMLVAVQEGNAPVSHGAEVSTVLTIKNAKLWTPDTPHLYDLRVTLLKNGQPIDAVTSYATVRTIGRGPDEKGLQRLLLNGKPLFQIGPLDQGWWPDGLLTPPSDAGMVYDLEVLKKLGMNMLRKHIKVEPARYYLACDKLGLIVWQDMPSGMARGRKQFVQPNWSEDGEFTQEEKFQFGSEMSEMMDHLGFFGCIGVWVPFNEGWGQHDTNAVLQSVKMRADGRLVNGPSGWTDRGFGDMKDMHNYPGPGMFPPMPDRVSVLGEYGGLGLPVKGHLWKETDNWGYRTFKNETDLRAGYGAMIARMRPLIAKGLAAAVYTQTTDVEVEVNGLLTYDREVLKFDVAETAAWHKSLFEPAPTFAELVPTSKSAPQTWSYTFERPADGWEKPEFDASGWKTGPGGFGTEGTPNARIGTKWDGKEIWLRRTFELAEVPAGEVGLTIHHDEDCEIYLNGKQVLRLGGHVTEYVEAPLPAAAKSSLVPGKNVLAVRCTQTRGGQYIDVGVVAEKK